MRNPGENIEKIFKGEASLGKVDYVYKCGCRTSESRKWRHKMGRRKGITISKVRSFMYGSARSLGDIQAVIDGPDKTVKRIQRRILGRLLGRIR